jgi:Uncharacterized protein, possibly involved in aromatic compounds catabolism
MSFIKKLAKWSLVVAPLGGIAYLNRHYYFGNVHKIHTFDESQLSDDFKKYIRENNLISPYLYKNYQRKYGLDHFFEKSILKDLNGLNEYNIFLDKRYHDVITDAIEVSKEERAELHKTAKLHCIFVANSGLQGHLGIVHGGFLSTLLDNLCGCLSFLVTDFNPAVTAYLNMNFKKPVYIGKEYIAVIEVDRIEGKKIFFKGTIKDKDNTVHCTSDSLFIKVKMDNFYMNKVFKSLLLEKGVHDYEHTTGKPAPKSILKQEIAKDSPELVKHIKNE